MGPEDSKQPNNPSSPNSTSAPTPAQNATQESGPGIQKTGEIMIGFALAIIFVVILCVTLHLILRQRKRDRQRNPSRKRSKNKDDASTGTSELHSADKKVFEVAGTQVILCELPEAPPLQEMEAGDVGLISPIERGMTGTTTSEIDFGPDAISPEDPSPEGRQMAVYWSARL